MITQPDKVKISKWEKPFAFVANAIVGIFLFILYAIGIIIGIGVYIVKKTFNLKFKQRGEDNI